MKTAPLISAIWDRGGPYAGVEGRPNAYVTVQMPWGGADPYVVDGDEDHVIHPTSTAGGGTKTGEVLRWFQKADNSQNERRLPNVLRISIDRSIDNDAATCSIEMSNQWMRNNNDPSSATTPTVGTPGYFTPSHGATMEAAARWGHQANDWAGVLVPNAMIRTYQGYGGYDKPLEEALEDGNVVLTGVWLVDSVDVRTDGRLNISCRDMMKLLINQQLYPPLVPADKYPLQYYRYVIEMRDIEAGASARFEYGDVRTIFHDSSVDRRFPGHIATGGAEVGGWKASMTLDSNLMTFAISTGYDSPTGACDWWEYEVGEYANAVWVYPWAGNYTAYISVMENDLWQGTEYVPASAYGASIPYVLRTSIPWEAAVEILLPRLYNAQYVRISLMNHQLTGFPTTPYYAGIRQFRVKTSEGGLAKYHTEVRRPITYAADAYRDPEDPAVFGYMTVSTRHAVDIFGDMIEFEQSGGHGVCNHDNHGCAVKPQNDGYWILCQAGHITAYGSAEHYGEPFGEYDNLQNNRTSGLISTPSGNGYWVVGWDGRIFAYGDATPYADQSRPSGEFFHAAQGHLTEHGLWLLATNGAVFTRGAAQHYGNWSKSAVTNTGQEDNLSEIAIDIRPTLENDGYWILSTGGRVDAKGAAEHYGEVGTPVENHDSYERYYNLLPSPTNDAYLIQRGDGRLFQFGSSSGTTIQFGGPTPGSQGQLRRQGNYLDYSDIIKELALWSGFLLFDPATPLNQFPPVYGNIESTGAYSPEPLPDSLFDKRPVLDAMTEIKEVVGYILFVDDFGALRFESPNWWGIGNVDEQGHRSSFIPEIDERVNLVSYGTSTNDDALRSTIIISSEDPDDAGDTTITTVLRPQTADGLKGLLVPAMWVNGWFQDAREQRIMADLIALHIWFQQRTGQISAVANPCIQVNDQIRVYERVTSEVFIHYVRGMSTSQDLESGQYVMNITTNWLGTPEEGGDWVITANSAYRGDPYHYVLDPATVEWLQETESAVLNSSPSAMNDPFNQNLDDLLGGL